jgi:hypothetical protein
VTQKPCGNETRLYFKASPPLALILCIRMGGSYIGEENADISLHQKAHQVLATVDVRMAFYVLVLTSAL